MGFPTKNDQHLGCEMGGTTISGNAHIVSCHVIRVLKVESSQSLRTWFSMVLFRQRMSVLNPVFGGP